MALTSNELQSLQHIRRREALRPAGETFSDALEGKLDDLAHAFPDHSLPTKEQVMDALSKVGIDVDTLDHYATSYEHRAFIGAIPETFEQLRCWRPKFEDFGLKPPRSAASRLEEVLARVKTHLDIDDILYDRTIYSTSGSTTGIIETLSESAAEGGIDYATDLAGSDSHSISFVDLRNEAETVKHAPRLSDKLRRDLNYAILACEREQEARPSDASTEVPGDVLKGTNAICALIMEINELSLKERYFPRQAALILVRHAFMSIISPYEELEG